MLCFIRKCTVYMIISYNNADIQLCALRLYKQKENLRVPVCVLVLLCLVFSLILQPCSKVESLSRYL